MSLAPTPDPDGVTVVDGCAPVGAVYGWTVASDVPLARLSDASAVRRGRLLVLASDELHAPADAVMVLDAAGTPDVPSYRAWRAGRRIHVASERNGAWTVDPGVPAVHGAPTLTAHHEHHLWAVVVPLLLAELGDLPLHASAVVVDGACVAFVGHSGRGKSTTAAAALDDPAVSLVTEEALLLSGGEGGDQRSAALAWPGPPGVRLLADARAALGELAGSTVPSAATPASTPGRARKVALDTPARHATGPVPLAALCLLAPPDGERPHLERVRPVAAVPQLLPHTLVAPDRTAETVRRLAALAPSTPVFRVRFPVGLDGLPAHVGAVLRTVRAEAPSVG